MSKTKNTRQHYLIVQAHMSHGYQIFTATNGAYKEGIICWPGLSPKTLRVREDGDGCWLPEIRIRVRGQQGSGLHGITDTNIYGGEIEIQCAYNGFNSERQAEALGQAWRGVKARLKKFDSLGREHDYVGICLRLAAALDYGLATKSENHEIRVTDADGFRWWVQQQAQKSVKGDSIEA